MSALAGRTAIPEFDRGWRIDGPAEPFLAYEQAVDLGTRSPTDLWRPA